ncbi:hypothetical protein E2C01_048666 [Portunus trituberculatus]|uniref:Uncharacterized protein n=1 Tax=Portunus trituberculatus TaxID=210409 RepID=A0A5B7G4D7_PORTR|nr:hypothetical protein [Portunus trituberculatus]
MCCGRLVSEAVVQAGLWCDGGKEEWGNKDMKRTVTGLRSPHLLSLRNASRGLLNIAVNL